MLTKDLFRVLIRLIGLYFYINILFTQVISPISAFGFDADSTYKISILIYIFVVFLFSTALLYFITINTDKIINLFQLDKGFENKEINLHNLNAQNILLVGIFIVGGLLIVENLSNLFIALYNEYRFKVDAEFMQVQYNSTELIYSSLNIFIGLILILTRKNIAHFFEK